MKFTGDVLKYGDNVDTDVIIPARYLNTSDPKELATHCMEDIDKTFAKREYVGEPLITIDVLRESELIRSRWKIYQRKYEYAKDIDFDDILDCILKMMEQRDPVVV